MSEYLQNAWYVVAWSREVGDAPFARKICEVPLVMFRAGDGITVLDDRCPHRYAPLSSGRVVDGSIQCGYHGLRFGTDGRCTHNPYGDKGNPRLRTPSYVAVERYQMVWVWFGDPALADPGIIPDFSCHDSPAFRRIDGVFEIKANYKLVLDNVLDLTHAEFVHDGVLSSDAITASKLQLRQEGTTLWANRWCPDGAATPAWAMAFGNYDKPVDQWLYMRWDAPASLLFDVGMTPVGKSRADGIWQYGTDILVPVDSTTMLYFWAFSRNYAIDDPEVDAFWRQSVAIAFEDQDRGILEAQQRMLGDRDIEDLPLAVTEPDKAAIIARRLLKKLARASVASSNTRPGAEPPLELLARNRASSNPVLPVV